MGSGIRRMFELTTYRNVTIYICFYIVEWIAHPYAVLQNITLQLNMKINEDLVFNGISKYS